MQRTQCRFQPRRSDLDHALGEGEGGRENADDRSARHRTHTRTHVRTALKSGVAQFRGEMRADSQAFQSAQLDCWWPSAHRSQDSKLRDSCRCVQRASWLPRPTLTPTAMLRLVPHVAGPAPCAAEPDLRADKVQEERPLEREGVCRAKRDEATPQQALTSARRSHFGPREEAGQRR